MKLVLVRHGQTDENLVRRIQGQSNTQLNNLGRLQAQCVARRLASMTFDTVYSSDLDRALTTARTIVPQQDIIQDARLRERGFGQWSGQLYSTVKEQSPELIRAYESQDLDFAPPGGETLRQLRARAVAFLEDLTSAAEDSTILAVSHGGLIQAVFNVVVNPLEQLQQYIPTMVGNTAIARFVYRNHRWMLVSWNDTAHLESLDNQ